MKALIILVILATLAIIFFQYSRNRSSKKLLISFATLIGIVSLAVMGNMTRQVLPLFMLHIVFIIASWCGLIIYLIKEKYYWWVIFSPVITLGLFLVLEFLTGSAHELG